MPTFIVLLLVGIAAIFNILSLFGNWHTKRWDMATMNIVCLVVNVLTIWGICR